MPNANEEERDDLEVTDTEDEPQNADTDGDEASEESQGEETSDDTIQVSRSEYEKLKRESFAAKRLREKPSHKDGETSKESGSQLDQELIARTFLAAQAGIVDKEVQSEAMRLANKFGMNIAEAMDDPDISTRLKNLQKQKETQKAIAKGTGGSATRTKDVQYYLTYFKQHNDFPAGTPSSMIAKVAGMLE